MQSYDGADGMREGCNYCYMSLIVQFKGAKYKYSAPKILVSCIIVEW